MSLKHAANHLAAHGRGPDTELVHMTKGEINSLQSLARANGGSLTINPQTGLAEAGFLSSILPMALGAGAMFLSGGTAAPLLGGLGMGLSSAGVIGTGIGALQFARTGSLQKGLMAGLGAYGGAGLAGGLMTAGAQQVAGNTLAQEAGKEAALQGTTLPSNYAQLAGQTATPAQVNLAMTGQPATALQQATPGMSGFEAAGKGVDAIQSGGLGAAKSAMQAAGGPGLMKAGFAAAAPAIGEAMTPSEAPPLPAGDNSMPQRLRYEAGLSSPMPAPDVPDFGNLNQDFGRMQSYYPNARYANITPEEAKQLRGFAGGGTVEQMSDNAALGTNTMYPMANMTTSAFATPYQDPRSANMMTTPGGSSVDQMTGQMMPQGTNLARGGIADAHYNLGGYSDGGRLLRGPGDGVSDSIPATIGKKQPARLADGEFVIPARIVSELGNGSTEAGARRLYAMMDRVQGARGKTVGKGKVAVNSKADRLLPA